MGFSLGISENSNCDSREQRGSVLTNWVSHVIELIVWRLAMPTIWLEMEVQMVSVRLVWVQFGLDSGGDQVSCRLASHS